MFSSVSMNQSFLSESKLAKNHPKLKESDLSKCSNFTVGKDAILKTNCQGDKYEIDLNHCVSYKESTLLAYEPNLQLKTDCRNFKVETITRKDDGAKQIIFVATCALHFADKDAIAEINTAVIPLEDFLQFDKNNHLSCHSADDDIEKMRKFPIDNHCESMEIHNSGIIAGICNIGKKHFLQKIKFEHCVDEDYFNHKQFGFVKDCMYCAGHKVLGINLLACTCRDNLNRTKKNWAPLNDYVELVGSKLKCVSEKHKDFESESRLLTNLEYSDRRNIPKESIIEVLVDDREKKAALFAQKKPIVRLHKSPVVEAPTNTPTKDIDIPDKPIVEAPKVIVIGNVVKKPVSTPSQAKVDKDEKKKINKKIAIVISKVKIAEEAVKEKIAKAAKVKIDKDAAKVKIAKEAAEEKIAKEAAKVKIAKEAAKEKIAKASKIKIAKEAAKVKIDKDAAKVKIAKEAAKVKIAKEAAEVKIAKASKIKIAKEPLDWQVIE